MHDCSCFYNGSRRHAGGYSGTADVKWNRSFQNILLRAWKIKRWSTIQLPTVVVGKVSAIKGLHKKKLASANWAGSHGNQLYSSSCLVGKIEWLCSDVTVESLWECEVCCFILLLVTNITGSNWQKLYIVASNQWPNVERSIVIMWYMYEIMMHFTQLK